MADGRVLVSDSAGTYVLKLTGDVRVTLCATLDDFLHRMFSDQDFKSVIVDLSDAEGVDSTTLGLLARLSIKAGAIQGHPPALVTPNPDITRILTTMGLDDVFDLIEVAPRALGSDLGELDPCSATNDEVRLRVIDAHRTLMELNERNEEAFRELVASLENSY